ncbi:BREX-3 system P-loop-containing protein BrxF [Methanolobus bombayensis]|uniref:BREX-3 system P-loop-containing protein BrxF n=1 Tax=Methanolobus bombayensis TaxID=38023 RepID=UPI001AE12238|nr:BREX-3 system P-loop-containing protein BrxF [Methanolobus bombayensis]MBP1908573.1 Cdc6-like AAA superfamily ATPase [Methanolobus bombayensis]
MVHTIQNELKRYLKDADDLYHKLVLLVGKSDSGKTAVLKDVAEELGVPVINVNLSISEQLIELTPKQRSLRISDILMDVISKNPSIKVLDNLEILFDRKLKTDPLKILQKISRNHVIIASWNGYLEYGKLIYAEPGLAEYRSYDIDDILIVEMENGNNND